MSAARPDPPDPKLLRMLLRMRVEADQQNQDAIDFVDLFEAQYLNGLIEVLRQPSPPPWLDKRAWSVLSRVALAGMREALTASLEQKVILQPELDRQVSDEDLEKEHAEDDEDETPW